MSSHNTVTSASVTEEPHWNLSRSQSRAFLNPVAYSDGYETSVCLYDVTNFDVTGWSQNTLSAKEMQICKFCQFCGTDFKKLFWKDQVELYIYWLNITKFLWNVCRKGRGSASLTSPYGTS